MKKLYLGLAVIIALGISSLIFFGVISISNLVAIPLLVFAENHFALLNFGTIILLLLSVILLAKKKRKIKNKGV